MRQTIPKGQTIPKKGGVRTAVPGDGKSLDGSRPVASTRPGRKQGLLRELSEQAVLESVFRDGPISRPEIAARAGLTKPTVSQAVAALELAGLVWQSGEARGGPGPVAKLYSVVPNSSCVIGAEISYLVSVFVANVFGEILAETTARTDKRGGRHVLKQLLGATREAISAAGVDATEVTTMGLAVPGVIDTRECRLRNSGSVPGLEQIDLVRSLEESLGVRVLADNTVNLSAVGEKWRGRGKGHSDFVLFGVGTHVGMGVVAGDELYRGHHGLAGQAALLPLSADPYTQGPGSFEARVGREGFVRSAREFAKDHASTRVPETAEDVFEMAKAGDQAALRAIEEESRLLALAIASAVAILDPELVVMEGGVGVHGLMVAAVRRHVGRLIPSPPPIEPTALQAEADSHHAIGGRAAVHGALETALRAARRDLFARRQDGPARVARARGPTRAAREPRKSGDEGSKTP